MPRDIDDDIDDDLPVKKPAQGPLDGMFRDTSMVVLILFACCCNGIALILGIVALATAKDPTAKQNALTVTIIAGIITVLGIVAQVIQIIAGAGAGLR